MRRGVVLVAVLGVLAVGGCSRGEPAVAPTGTATPSAASDPDVQEVERTVIYVEQLLNDTEGEMAADPQG